MYSVNTVAPLHLYQPLFNWKNEVKAFWPEGVGFPRAAGRATGP